MAEAIILGSGTSSGVPVLGLEYPPGYLANPKNHRTRPSLLVIGPLGNLIVDCPPDLRTQLLREDIKDVDEVLITHTHADHVMGMDDLRAFSLKLKHALPIFAGSEAQEDIRRIFKYAFIEHAEGVEVPRFELHPIEPTMRLCGLEVETFWVWHGPMPVVGLRIGGFAYLTDVNEIPSEAWSKLQGLDTLVLDAVRRKPHPNHFHFDRSVEVALELDAKMTYFTHLSHDYDHDVTNASLPPRIALAYDGLRIRIE